MGIFLMMITTLCCAPKVIGVLNAPKNVHMTSWNMDMVLRWDPPDNTSEVFYWTEFSSTVSLYRSGCANISVRYCDFTTPNPISIYGTYTGRVRAQRGKETSIWVETRPLTLDKDTTIGPPNVTLVSNGVHITVNIRDPVFRNSEMRRVHNQASYNITYWRENEEDKAQNLIAQQNPVVLSDLEPLSRYCVKVHIETQPNLTPSQESQVTCEKTTEHERTLWLEALVTFFVMAILVTMLVVVVVFRKKLSNFLFPKDSLPQYFKKNVFENPSSLTHLAMGPYCPPMETYDQVKVMTTENNTDDGRPLVVKEDQLDFQP